MAKEGINDEALDALDDVIKRFNTNFFVLLQKLRDPSKHLRNLILIFLTIFHDELDDLVDDLEDDESEIE